MQIIILITSSKLFQLKYKFLGKLICVISMHQFEGEYWKIMIDSQLSLQLFLASL